MAGFLSIFFCIIVVFIVGALTSHNVSTSRSLTLMTTNTKISSDTTQVRGECYLTCLRKFEILNGYKKCSVSCRRWRNASLQLDCSSLRGSTTHLQPQNRTTRNFCCARAYIGAAPPASWRAIRGWKLDRWPTILLLCFICKILELSTDKHQRQPWLWLSQLFSQFWKGYHNLVCN